MPTVKHKKNKRDKARSPISYVLYSIYFLLIIGFIGYHIYYANKILWKITVNGRDFSGLTAQQSIEKIKNEFPKDGSVKVKIDQGYEKDLSYQDIGFEYLDVETTSNAFEIGRETNFLQSLKSKFTAIFKSIDIKPSYKYDEAKLDIAITNIKKEAGLLAQETHFEIADDEVVIIEGTTGRSFEDESIKNRVLSAFESENYSQIDEPLVDVNPKLTVADLEKVKGELESHIDVGYTLKYENKEWAFTKPEMAALFDVVKNDAGEVSLRVNDLEVIKKLSSIVSELDRNPRGQVLEVENGKAVKFVSSEDGLRLKIKETSEEVKKDILAKTKEIPVLVQVATAPETENEFGIRELIATGTSTFKGSIPGRVFNIGLASSRVSGTLVPPGEEFSFVEAVGEISRKTGYTSAYVISAGRTVLGDGGGVCQVSTTLFRAALNAGLPITERNPHAYRVGYYEQDSPPGIDAAIYSPSVDMKFLNNTPGYILITSEFDEKNSALAFRIYGTKDGREVEISKPKILSQTPPPATIYEDDPTLAKGQTKQVEHSVWGASVSFGRIVKKEGQVVSDDTFKSNYRAWPTVYKVGTRE